jgi:crotonobetainyl-CoA:carnitine CoA-transferase CaiB-like acyl-CoA transferase
MGALFHRERTGEATTVDVSLLGTALWSLGGSMALTLQLQQGWRPPPADRLTGNPLVSTYKTKDDRWISLCCLQAGKYWAEACEVVGRPELATDERFADPLNLMANAAVAAEQIAAAFADRTLDEWRERLDGFSGQWAVVQDTLEAASDPQTVANGYVGDCVNAEGVDFQLVTSPVQYDDAAAAPKRAPQFNEHGDAILESLGLDWDTIVDLKVRGVVP